MKKLGIIAGSGGLPYNILEYCKKNNIEPLVVSFTTKLHLYCAIHKIQYIRGKLGEIGAIINFFKDNGIFAVVMAGNILVPDLSILLPDLEGKRLLNRIKQAKFGGDNRMLNQVIEFFEQDHQFKIMPVQHFLDDLLIKTVGIAAGTTPNQTVWEDIKIGEQYLETISEFDVGQAVVVRNQKIIAVEAEEGTQQMLLRVKELNKNKAYGGVLVKIPKLDQSMKLDVPSIGLATAKVAVVSKLAAIAIKAAGCFVIDKGKCIKYLDQNKVSLIVL